MVGTVAITSEEVIVRTTLDPGEQPFLDDHRIDGVAVLPGVMGIEAFAEVAHLLAPGRQVAAVEDVDFLAPLKFYRDEPRELTIRATGTRDHADIVVRCSLEAERTLPGAGAPQRTTHFTGTVRLSATAAAPEHAAAVREPDATLGSRTVYDLYFHGPAYRVVAATWPDHVATVARLATDLPPDHVGGPEIVHPRLVELCFQTAGLLEAAGYGRLALPQHVDCLRLLSDPPSGPLYAVAIQSGDGFDCTLQTAAGEVVLGLDGYRTIALPAPVPGDLRHRLTASGAPELSSA
jgi:hypothetical protein